MTAATVTVVCDLYDGSGNPVTHGTAWFAPGTALTDAADGMYIPQAPVPAEFRSRVSPAVGLLPTDDPSVLPSGWTWGVQFAYIAGQPAPFSFFLPAGPAPFTAAAGTPCTLGWSATTALTSLPGGTGVRLSGGSVPTAFSTAATYYVVNPSGTTLTLAASRGGSAIASPTAGSGDLAVVQYSLSALAPAASGTIPVAITNLDGGSAATGAFPVGDVDGGDASG